MAYSPLLVSHTATHAATHTHVHDSTGVPGRYHWDWYTRRRALPRRAPSVESRCPPRLRSAVLPARLASVPPPPLPRRRSSRGVAGDPVAAACKSACSTPRAMTAAVSTRSRRSYASKRGVILWTGVADERWLVQVQNNAGVRSPHSPAELLGQRYPRRVLAQPTRNRRLGCCRHDGVRLHKLGASTHTQHGQLKKQHNARMRTHRHTARAPCEAHRSTGAS